MASEKPTPARKAVWFDEELWEAAKKVGPFEGKTPAEVLEDIVRVPLMRKLRNVVAREHVELGEAGA